MSKLTSATIVPFLLLIITQLNNAEDSKREICFDDTSNCYIREGETIITRVLDEKRSERRSRRQAIRRYNNLTNIWNEGVDYYFDSSITLEENKRNSKLIKEFDYAMKAWQQDTCVNFNKVDPPHYNVKEKRDVLRVTADEEGCASHTGKLGGEQPLILGKGCESFGHIAHELGHALGLYHTMARHDRDSYITVKPETMEEKYRIELDRQTEENNENYGIGYDYGSIMHYPSRNDFSKNQASMIPVDERYISTMGSEMISFADLWMINKLYSCEDACAGKSTKDCKYGGFAHPRNCSRCLCPGGYGGDDCTERPNDGCGKVLEAEKHWKKEFLMIQNLDASKYLDGYKKCHYWIKGRVANMNSFQSPDNTRIQVMFRTDHFQGKFNGCVKAGIEIKTNQDQTLTGYRLCSEDDDKTTFISSSNLVPVIAYTREFFASIATIKYRYLEQGDDEKVDVDYDDDD